MGSAGKEKGKLKYSSRQPLGQKLTCSNNLDAVLEAFLGFTPKLFTDQVVLQYR
jgi:hypothetical protein